MTGRILVVDDLQENRRLLEDQLRNEYFEVVTAGNGLAALQIAETTSFDLFLIDAMMPGLDGFEVCKRLKAARRSAQVPVVMITALDQPSDRVRGLEAGADDFLTKPVASLDLITRVKNLVRLKLLTDELHLRAPMAQDLQPTAGLPTGQSGRILVVDDRSNSRDRLMATLAAAHQSIGETPEKAVMRASDPGTDLVIVSLSLDGEDPLRLCSRLRSEEKTRHLPLLVVADPDDQRRLRQALDLGVNDYVLRPVDRNELLARVRTQVQRKRYADRLRETVQTTMALALTDGLTGLHNRRYLESHLSALVEQALGRGRNLSLLIIDIDHFKPINDTWGHDVGDAVLREFAHRLRRNVRGVDIVCRLGGEEFVVVMPDTDRELAGGAADRLRESIAREPFGVPGGRATVTVTISIGIGALNRPLDTPEQLMKRADVALYSAKRDGRNRVVTDAA